MNDQSLASAPRDFAAVGSTYPNVSYDLRCGTLRPVSAQSISSVGAVVVFEEETPLSLIEALHPDLLIKGNDYTLDRVAGANLVRSWGGKVMLIDIVPGFSTTGILALTNDNV